jgi:hypothetical protein
LRHGPEASKSDPLYLDTGRAISGDFPSSTRAEMAVHLQVAYVIKSTPKVNIMIAGGPSFVSVKQSLVSGVEWADKYPFDTATFTKATGSDVSKSKLGFNVGLDASYYLSPSLGIGVMARYVAVKVDLPAEGDAVSVNGGGLQAGVGLRLRIPRRSR